MLETRLSCSLLMYVFKQICARAPPQQVVQQPEIVCTLLYCTVFSKGNTHSTLAPSGDILKASTLM